MKESTKKTIKELSVAVMSIGFFVFVAYAVPDGSTFKNYFAYFCALVLVSAAIWLTPIGNPLKKLIRKISGKK